MRSDPLPSFANYTIERELGAGGMAVVYLAHDLRHDRDVAIKVLHPELGAAIGGERFLAEIKTTARLQHPHILPLLDSGHAGGLYYYVMPYVAGETLRSRLDREGQLPMDDAIRIAREIADALGAAHALGIIHRDVKPENILLQGGHALVADFGIALAVQHAGGARMTQTGLSLGTPQYMSPEQAMGEKQIDLRTDIYALGAVTYEMLAGEPPFTGASVQAIIAKAMTERPTPLRTVRDTVPPGVEAAILKSIAKLPADRFSSATAFSDALVNSAHVFTQDVAQPSAVKHSPRAIRIWQTVAGLVVAVAAVALMIPRGAPAVHAVLVQRQITYEGNVVGAAISPDGLWLAYVQDDCALVDREACSHTLQVREVDGVQSVHIATWHYIDPDLHWSGDGKSVVFKGSEKGSADNVFVVDRLGGTPRQMHVSPTAMTVMPDGHTLAMTVGPESGQWIQRWDLNTLTLVDSARLPPRLGITSLSASPVDGTLAAVGRFSGTAPKVILLDSHARLLDSLFAGTREVVRWDSTGTAILVFDDGESGSPASDILRVAVGRNRFDRNARPATVLGQITEGSKGRFDVSRTGRLALVSQPVAAEMMVGALGAAPGAWRSIRPGSTSMWGTGAFTMDGKRILAGASDNLAENLYEFPLLPGRPRALTSYRGTATTGGRWAQEADVSPDGAHIAYLRGSANSVDYAFVDSGGGRDRRIATGSLVGYVGPRWLTNGVVVIKRNGAFVSLDTTGVVRDSVIIPDSIGHRDGAWMGAWMNRAEKSVYFMTNRGSIAAADFRTHQVRSAARADFALVVVGWLPNGSLLVSDATLEGTGITYKSLKTSVFRVEPDGTLTLVSRVPRHCLSVTIDRAGTTLACTVVSVGGDVQLAVATSR